MGNELLGKIYFSVDDEDWHGDTSEPVLHGFHLLDYVSTNRWSFISSNQKTCKTFLHQEENAISPNKWNLPLIELAETFIVLDSKRGKEDVFSGYPDDILLPASFDPNNSYLIDILLFLGIKLKLIDESDAAILSNEWTGIGEFEIIDVEIEMRVISKINEVIDFLVNNKIRVGAVSRQSITKYPQRYNEIDFPNIENLRFNCYSPIS
jgi:hypothetical protein